MQDIGPLDTCSPGKVKTGFSPNFLDENDLLGMFPFKNTSAKTFLKVHSMSKGLSKVFEVPTSKPETQRAILVGSLAQGTSYVYNDLRCSETAQMKDACRLIGAKIIEHEHHLEITGVAGVIATPARVIDCKGSGLVFRVFTALSSFATGLTVVTGDKILCGRVMKPLFDALRTLGAVIENICQLDKAPIVNRGVPLLGGECELPGDISSQFVTAILLAAPLANGPTTIKVSGEIFSLSYIQQTISFMRSAGIQINFDEILGIFTVFPGKYSNFTSHIKEDYTSATYLLVTAALTQGETRLRNMHAESLQGERAILEILTTLGIDYQFDKIHHELIVNNPHVQLTGHYCFDSKDYPNIVPTLAVLGAFVHGSFTVTGAALTRFHKASRVEAICSELKKLGVVIEVLYKDHIPDGFKVYGKSDYIGNALFESWGDHRIFMSLFIMSLHTKMPCYFTGYEDTDCSFPGFFKAFEKLDVKMEVIENSTTIAD